MIDRTDGGFAAQLMRDAAEKRRILGGQYDPHAPTGGAIVWGFGCIGVALVGLWLWLMPAIGDLVSAFLRWGLR